MVPIVSEHSTFGLTAEVFGWKRLSQQAFPTHNRDVQIVLDPQASYGFVNGAPMETKFQVKFIRLIKEVFEEFITGPPSSDLGKLIPEEAKATHYETSKQPK